MMYFRFMVFLGLGMFGVSLVLKTLMDTLFHDWDMLGEMRAYLAERARRNRFAHIADYDRYLAPRLSAEPVLPPMAVAKPFHGTAVYVAPVTEETALVGQ